ncbi:hypothetical protein [Nocardia camponoti]|uniref:hypothetical protein n=1 Tax=Nocardia camponoti TaxID=1616106 RepID=UPI00166D7AFF|nr:hypothetical protein [Nocardia camponoti]
MLFAVWMLFGQHGIHPAGGLWLVPEIGIPLGLLAFRGIPRRIGGGMLVLPIVPFWPYFLVMAIVVLGPPVLLYLVIVGVSHLIGLGGRRSGVVNDQ